MMWLFIINRLHGKDKYSQAWLWSNGIICGPRAYFGGLAPIVHGSALNYAQGKGDERLQEDILTCTHAVLSSGETQFP
jgi:hypothetical protein